MERARTAQLEGYSEMTLKFVKTLPVEERLWGLTPEELLPVLPVELLRVLPDDYLQSLPPDVQEKIKQRLGR